MNTEWMRDAACRRIPDLPWTADKGTAPVVLGELMADVCAMCPVRDACAAFVVEADVTGGYWAGRHRNVDNLTLSRRQWVQETLFDGDFGDAA